jgi:hypothetical protein
MAINKKSQSLPNRFSQQSKDTLLDRTNATIRQDKGRLKSARIASAQPAPHEHVMRPQQLDNNTSRSQNRPNPKRKTVHLTLWVKPIVKGELQRIAEQEGLSVSKVGSAFLERAIQQHVDMQYSALLQPIIESAIHKEMAAMSTRLAWLLAD